MDLYLHSFAFMTCTGTILPLYASILLDSKALLKIFVTDDYLLYFVEFYILLTIICQNISRSRKLCCLGRQSKISHVPASRSVASIEVHYMILKGIYSDRWSVDGIWKIKGFIATFIFVNFKWYTCMWMYPRESKNFSHIIFFKAKLSTQYDLLQPEKKTLKVETTF